MTYNNAFTLIKETKHPSLDQSLLEFKHDITGARHIHIQSDDPENTFMVVLKTIPEDETGVAHILEHITLCGSERFPVRDPFFMMLRRSLNTYMNASTANDHTSYYFASQNKKDFFNLMQVYCDAVFFPLLHPLDFAQEGHRKAINSDGKLEYRGVVYNEMKGATSDLTSQLWQRLNTLLYPSTTYRFNSGGEPKDIPNLSYDGMKKFHKKFYHPSNALFCTAGNIALSELQTGINDWVLSKYEGQQEVKDVHLQSRIEKKQIRTESFPAHSQAAHKAHHLRAWLLANATNVDEWIMAKVMSYLLAGDSAAPLMHFLETTSLGACPSSLTGLHAYFQQMSFVIGVEQSDEHAQKDWETQIDQLLQTIVKTGFDNERIAAVFDQFELQLKDRSASTPHGIQLLSRCVLPALHDQPIAEYLFLDDALLRCQKKLQDPENISNWIKKWLIDNTHQVILTAIPESKLIQENTKAIESELEDALSRLSNDAKDDLEIGEKSLEERQQSYQDVNVLPTLSLKDLIQKNHIIKPVKTLENTPQVALFNTPTHGITFQSMLFGLPALQQDDWPLVTVLADIMGCVGAGECSYLEHEKKQTRFTGGVGIDLWLNELKDGIHAYFQLETKSLNRHFDSAETILHEIWHTSVFDDQARIKDLVAQSASDGLESIAYNGHRLAMSASWAQVNHMGFIKNKIAGLPQFLYLSNLTKSLKDSQSLETFCSDLTDWYQNITKANHSATGLLVGDNLSEDKLSAYANQWDVSGSSQPQKINFVKSKPIIWLCDVQVNYCAMSCPVENIFHDDAASFAVLSQILTNGFLHRVIREQGGAYGGGAVYRPLSGEFSFYSYRDPNAENTFKAFRDSIDWVIDNHWDKHLFDEAIISLIGQYDKPETPIGGPKRVFMNACSGFTEEDRIAYREKILNVSRDSVIRVANQYLLQEDRFGKALIAPKEHKSQYSEADYEIIEMN